MSFDVTKCSIMCFNQEPLAPVADYTLSEAKLETAHERKYLGVITQSDLKFPASIKQKVVQSKQQLGILKQVLHGATKKAKLLAYLLPLVDMPCQHGTLSSSTKFMALHV